MFDLGWQEFMLIALITVIVVGPKDLPRVVRTVSQWVRKARSMAREFHSSIEEVARESELDELRRELNRTSEESIGQIKSAVEEAKSESGMGEAVDEMRSMAEEAKTEATELSKQAAEDTDPKVAASTSDDAGAEASTSAEPIVPAATGADDAAEKPRAASSAGTS